MMTAHVLKGTKQEIARDLAQLPGEVCEAIVFLKEPAPGASDDVNHAGQDIFAEMRAFMVDVQDMDVQDMDDSRETIYTPIRRRMILLDTNLVTRMTTEWRFAIAGELPWTTKHLRL